MKRLFRLSVMAIAAITLFSGCQKYDDTQIRQEIKSLGERVAKLEAWCKSSQEAFGYVAVLKEAVKNMNSIGSVDVFEDESGSGYVITFTDGQTIRLYNGQNGDTFFGNVNVGSSCVEFILADGTSFFVDRITNTISFDSFETKAIVRGDTIWTVMNEAFTKSEFAAFTAELKTNNGTATSIATKSASDNSQWKIEALAPEFNEDGSLARSAGVVITNAPQAGGKGVLKVSLVTNDGREASSSLVVDIFPNYLAFEAVEAGATVSMEIIGECESPSLEYSTDLDEWITFDFSDPATITLENVGDKVYWRNTGTTDKFSLPDAENFLHFNLGAKEIAASGNIMSLLDIYCEMDEMPDEAYFTRLFDSDTLLVSAPELPATKLSPACYYLMFRLCHSLKTAPELPATIMEPYCYFGMFAHCKSLKEAPALLAETLANDCYYEMFAGCSSLEKAPELPAKTVVSECYVYMFMDCTSLVEAPALPATELDRFCYYGMFWKCSNLKNAPDLPAQELALYCYGSMFEECTSLETAPELQAETLANHCYESMFWDCFNLKNTPELRATELAPYCYTYMFGNCTSLTETTALPATELADYCYAVMFGGCTSLEKAPELPAENLVTACYESLFEECEKIDHVKVGFTDWGDGYMTRYWLNGTASEGSFEGPEILEAKYGENYIPEGWTFNGRAPESAAASFAAPATKSISVSHRKPLALKAPEIQGKLVKDEMIMPVL